MKDWLSQKLTGDGPMTEALRDLLWAMPWWLPYFLISWAVLWLFFLWLSRCRRRRAKADEARPASPRPSQGAIRRKRGGLRGVA